MTDTQIARQTTLAEYLAAAIAAFLAGHPDTELQTVKRALIKDHMKELQKLCETADANADPFDNPGETTHDAPLDGTGSTPEELDRLAQIEREIEEENRKQAEGV